MAIADLLYRSGKDVLYNCCQSCFDWDWYVYLPTHHSCHVSAFYLAVCCCLVTGWCSVYLCDPLWWVGGMAGEEKCINVASWHRVWRYTGICTDHEKHTDPVGAVLTRWVPCWPWWVPCWPSGCHANRVGDVLTDEVTDASVVQALVNSLQLFEVVGPALHTDLHKQVHRSKVLHRSHNSLN